MCKRYVAVARWKSCQHEFFANNANPSKCIIALFLERG
jgi:hypothetical protein